MNMQNELIEAETNYPAAGSGVWTSGAINKNGLRTILVPTDFSEYSDMALRTALDIAKQKNASIYLLHVTGIRQIEDKKEIMQTQIDKFPDAKLVEITPDIRKGAPYEAILKMQAEKEIDLIVVALHEKKRLIHPLAGSVVKKIVKEAKCSVLVVGK
jgi:nucleotide-binding universal stress UspA family protein